MLFHENHVNHFLKNIESKKELPFMKTPATIKDIARASGVSIATVSRVINGTAPVLPETRQRVEEAIRRQDYTPNALARGLVSRHTNSIGVTIPDISNPYFSSLFCEIEATAHQNGFSVFLFNTMFSSQLSRRPRDFKEQDYFQMLLESQVAGAVIAGGQLDLSTPDPEYQEALRKLSQCVPLVILSDPVPNVSAVYLNREENTGMVQAIEYLASLGHKDIAFLGGEAGITITESRLKVYKDTLLRLGLTVNPDLIHLSDYYVMDGYTAARSLLQNQAHVSAVLAVNDNVALGALRAFSEAGIQVPGQISIISCEEFPMAPYYTPSLTAVKRHSDLFGHTVIQTLLSVIRKKEIGRIPTIASQLVVRESTMRWSPSNSM